MFFCVVNVGRYIPKTSHEPDLRIPPMLEGSKTLRYDSVKNDKDKHYIVYDNSKAFPGYIITYMS